MLQILQNLKNGETTLAEVPAPSLVPGSLLINTSTSLISAGTERMLVEFSKASMLDKARQQPDKVKMVLDKVRTDGLWTTLDAVKSKLDQPLPLGYCNVGSVIETGTGISGFSKGCRVVSNGPHAEIVRVPKNLCARIPDKVDDETASFTVIAAIAMQGIRLANPTIGEKFAVFGLGLIGQLTVQLLKANGCKVIGFDFDKSKLEIAQSFGAETVDLSAGGDAVEEALRFSNGKGVDGSIITASTKSNDPVTQSALMSRQRGRIILVGVTGLELNRSHFYEKELTFQVSCSYGPGRYDPVYEEKGLDYPIGMVRWTEQRNFEAILDLMADNRISVKPLISHRFGFAEAQSAYDTLRENSRSLGIILNYSGRALDEKLKRTIQTGQTAPSSSKALPVCGFLGAGNYASRVLIPAFAKNSAVLDSIASSGGVTSQHFGKKFGFRNYSTSSSDIINSDTVNTIVVATRHNSHARLVVDSLARNKNVFVEKPLAITLEEISEIKKRLDTASSRLMVGFNRRFSPHGQKMRQLLSTTAAPKCIIYTINAGAIPANHWTQDPEVGGGRIIGECCHFIDFVRFLTGSEITDYTVMAIGADCGEPVVSDKVSITLKTADGSVATIHYFANGAASFPKERVDVFCAGKVLTLDNFRKVIGHGWKGFTKFSTSAMEKGHAECAGAFLDSIKNGTDAPIPRAEILEVSEVTIKIADMLKG